MCPTDTTPDPRDMLRAPDTPEFLQPQPDAEAATSDIQLDSSDDMRQRPELPAHPVMTAADVKGEGTDPVDSDPPGVAERFHSDSTLQRG